MELTLQTYGLLPMTMLFFSKKEWRKQHFDSLSSENLKVCIKIHKEKTKYMTIHAASEDIRTDQEEVEKVTDFKYLGLATHLKRTTREEIYVWIRAKWSCFGKNRERLQER